MNAVVDANILIHSRGQFPFEKALIPESVEEEVKSRMAEMKMQKLSLTVKRPGEKFLEKVHKVSQKINSPTSDQDEDALALAIQEDLPLYTDDKALQNLALHLGVEFEGFNTQKVQEKRRWKMVCDNCGRTVSTPPCRCGCSRVERKRDRRS